MITATLLFFWFVFLPLWLISLVDTSLHLGRWPYKKWSNGINLHLHLERRWHLFLKIIQCSYSTVCNPVTENLTRLFIAYPFIDFSSSYSLPTICGQSTWRCALTQTCCAITSYKATSWIGTKEATVTVWLTFQAQRDKYGRTNDVFTLGKAQFFLACCSSHVGLQHHLHLLSQNGQSHSP